MNTLLLDTVSWDLVTDASGNIATATDPYSEAQDAASQIKLFSGELWYDTTQGIPYFSQILGQYPSLAYMKSQLAAAALLVPNVSTATVFLSSFTTRQVSGQVQITLTSGATAAANF